MGADVRAIEEKVVSFYLNSGDYNGLPLSRLAAELGTEPRQLLGKVAHLVARDRISVVSPYQTNPHVKMFDAPVEEQLSGIELRDPDIVCLYPTPLSVRAAIDVGVYDDRLFTKMITLGAPTLASIPFRLDVIDLYERDPRYWFRFYDFGGTISVTEEGYHQLEESDIINIRFGVGYDDDGDRVVGVYVYHLAKLPPKLQQFWQTYMTGRSCTMSEDYFRTSILGEWAKSVSVYQAIIYEQCEINILFKTMNRPHLFKDTYEDDGRPRGFSFFIKPTQSNFDEFVHTMDKMLSENINVDSFGSEVAREERVPVEDGTYNVERKGSLRILEDWLRFRFPNVDANEIATILSPLREVRELRQRPAHTIRKDKYDKRFYDQQDELAWNLYKALKRLRGILASDPVASGYEPTFPDGGLTVKSY